MPREFVNQNDVMEAIRDRLIDQIDGLNEANCFVSDYPNPVTIPAAEAFCTIAPGSGVFDQAMFAAAGFEQVSEQASIVVSYFQRWTADRTDSAAMAFGSEDRGLFRIVKPALLKALLVDDSSGTRTYWEPEKNGDGILRDQLAPVRSQIDRPEAKDGTPFISLMLEFSTNFDWEL